jgi:hypothetical protein
LYVVYRRFSLIDDVEIKDNLLSWLNTIERCAAMTST